MKSIIIEDWQKHADYMVYANIVDEFAKSVILQVQRSRIVAFGVGLDEFGKELSKRNIPFVETEQ